MSSSRATGDGGLSSPSEWSEDPVLFLFLAPTRVMVLSRNKEKTNLLIYKQQKSLLNSYLSYIPVSSAQSHFALVLLLLLLPAAGSTVPPTNVIVPPGTFTLLFLSAPTMDLWTCPPDTGLFFLLPPPLLFFLAADTTVTVPPISDKVWEAGSSSWFRTLGRFFSPRALARAMASATIRFAFSCLQRISTRRTDAGSPGALVIRMVWDGVVVVAEGPAADVLRTFTMETAPPADEAELV